MYLDSKDFQTVWQLAHNWVGADPDTSDPDALSTDLKETIHRLMAAAFNRAISVRSRRVVFFTDESLLSYIFEIHHFRKFIQCLRGDKFNKDYLNAIYLKRGDVLRWCQNEFLAPPPIWSLPKTSNELISSAASEQDDEDDGWYSALTPKRKQRIACLEMAKKLWKINSEWSYEEVYRHPIMRQYGNPEVFTLNSFKKWAREFAPESAKSGGRPKETNNYEALKNINKQ